MIKPLFIDADPYLLPYKDKIIEQLDYVNVFRERILPEGTALDTFALGHLYFGLHKTETGWVFREWAPNATRIAFITKSDDWVKLPEREMVRSTPSGVWEVELSEDMLSHGTAYRLHMYWKDGDGYRLPSYVQYAVQDSVTHEFDAVVWKPGSQYIWHDNNFSPSAEPLLIYEAHVGMAGEKEGVASYKEFTQNILPYIAESGYTTIQLMAIQEHPYYGSFGYHVSNYFAASSRFGTPDDLKELVDRAHQLGLAVILDIVHSHAVKNEMEGLSRFDGTYTQYFHDGDRGNHQTWDSRVFDYGKPEVVHFLLSNCRFWLEEYHFDGFRFDGVTSMLYKDHGIDRGFSSYDDYFSDQTDRDALAYLSLANELIHTVKPHAVTIAEDMSAYPGLAAPTIQGGVGFDYRLSMGVPDLWIRYIKEQADEQWDIAHLIHELLQRRPEEKTISYAESHDQALVGDKTLIFRLIDAAMYEEMSIDSESLVVDRGVALHKLIRLITASTCNGGYLTFMGNEFGHPEWIDFPRQGNEWSYAYARRQWSLVKNRNLRYQHLYSFEKAVLKIVRKTTELIERVSINDDHKTVSYQRGDLLFIYNFHPTRSYTDYLTQADSGNYELVIGSDATQFGGFDRIDDSIVYRSVEENNTSGIKVYIPARTALVLRRKSL